MNSRSPMWAQWLGWTVVFGLLFAGMLVSLVRHLVPNMNGHLVLGLLVMTLTAAFAIGVHFPWRWWVAGPPVAMVATVLAVLLGPDWGPGKPGPMGNQTPKDDFVFLLVWGGGAILIGLALVYGLLAWAGVWVGQRRGTAVSE